ncbi:MAG: Fe-Mn family superoxide dismutase [Pseudomonadota bacterium]
MNAVIKDQAEIYPLLDFTFPGLEGLSPEAMKTHLELYAGYVKEANAICAALADAGSFSGVIEAVHARESLSRRLAFELSGVRLHELFFEQLNPANAARNPQHANFMNCLTRSFGGFNNWVEDVKVVGKTRGPGWVATYQDGDTGRLNNLWIDLHHLAVPAGQQLVFVLDLWEHAYWDDYGAKGRPKYIADVLRQCDWAVVEQRMANAR